MSSKNHKSRGKDDDDDVDDFFDTPRKRDDSPEPKKQRNRRDSSDSRSRSPTPRSRRGRNRSYSDDYSDDSYTDDSRSRTPSSDRSDSPRRDKKNVRKIEARLPSAKTHTATFSMSDSKDYDSDDSGRRAPPPDKRKERNGKKDDAWGPETEGKSSKKGRPTSAHPTRGSKHRRSYSDSDSDTSSSETSTGSDVTDVSPLNSPHLHSASRNDFRISGNKPPKSPNRRDRPISAGSSGGRADLLHANKDSVDMKLLMEAILEMEQSRSRGDSEMRTKRTIQNIMYAPPPRAMPQQKKNFSFDNDKVRNIDRENQRLMQNILRHAQDAKKQKQKLKTQKRVEPMKPTRMTTSAINRMKEQQRIEQENYAMLKRLQQTKASKGVRRDTLMDDFNKTMSGYGFATPSSVKTHSVSSASPYEREGSVASGYSMASRTRSDAGSVASGGTLSKRRPQSAKIINRPTFRPVSAKQRPLSATTSTSSKRPRSATKPKWEDGW